VIGADAAYAVVSTPARAAARAAAAARSGQRVIEPLQRDEHAVVERRPERADHLEGDPCPGGSSPLAIARSTGAAARAVRCAKKLRSTSAACGLRLVA